MSRVRQRNTAPEQLVRSALHARGFRFTITGPKNKVLPGRPDIVLPKYRSIVFVHGCFWHGHRDCALSSIPRHRSDWWKKKFDENRARDRRVSTKLRHLGWNVITIWQCQIEDRRCAVRTIGKVARKLRSTCIRKCGADQLRLSSMHSATDCENVLK